MNVLVLHYTVQRTHFFAAVNNGQMIPSHHHYKFTGAVINISVSLPKTLIDKLFSNCKETKTKISYKEITRVQ